MMCSRGVVFLENVTTSSRSSFIMSSDSCYKCGKPGHFARECRSRGSGGERGGRGDRDFRSRSGGETGMCAPSTLFPAPHPPPCVVARLLWRPVLKSSTSTTQCTSWLSSFFAVHLHGSVAGSLPVLYPIANFTNNKKCGEIGGGLTVIPLKTRFTCMKNHVTQCNDFSVCFVGRRKCAAK